MKRFHPDPQEKGQPLVPIELQDVMFDWAEKSLRSYLQWAKDNCESYIMSDPRGNAAIRAEHITFLMYGFLAETGLPASQIQLCERVEQGQRIWTYERKHPVDVYVNAVIDKKEKEIVMLRRLLQEAQSEIRHIKGRP